MTRITALGDSLTKGVVLTDNNKYTVLDNNYIDILEKELNLNISNYSKFGCTVNYGECMLEKHSTDISQSDYTFVEYGGNDCDFDWQKIAETPAELHNPKTPLTAFKNKLETLIEKIVKLGSKPIIITLPPIDSERYFSFFTRFMTEAQKENVKKWLGGDINIISRWHESYNRVLFEVSEETGTQLIDITAPFATNEGGIRPLLCMDGIHPNHEGHRLIAGTILNGYL